MSSAAHAQSAPARPVPRVPALLVLERERQAKALERRLVGILHGHLSGSPSTAGRRSPAYRRMQLRGERRITVDDLCALALHPAKESKAALREFAEALLDATRPACLESVGEATAGFATECADVEATVLRSLSDGAITPAESERILREVTEVETQAQRLRLAALQAVRA